MRFKKNIYSTLFISTIGLILFFNNCSQQGAIVVSENSLSSLSSLESDEAKDGSIEDDREIVEEVINNCIDAERIGQLHTLEENIVFEDTRLETGRAEICEFSENGVSANGNLPMKESHMQAHYQQSRRLSLPENAVICDMKLTNQLQSFRYDDVFFLNFNGYLLASNNKSAVQEKLNPEIVSLNSFQTVDVFSFNWNKISSARFLNVADDYCLGTKEGLSSCSWPISEQPGQIQFSFDQSLIVALSVNTSSSSQRLSFVITGDNDKLSDCYHEKLEFQVKTKYYLKK